MRAVWFRFRAELRSRWRGLVAVALLAGTAGGVTLAALAGARRTDTAYSRLEAATNAYDVLVNPNAGTESALKEREVARLPEVEHVGRGDGIFLLLSRLQHPKHDLNIANETIVLSSSGGAFYGFARPKVEEGRMPRRDAADEVFLSTLYAQRAHLEVGDRVQSTGFSTADVALLEGGTLPPRQISTLVQTGKLGVRLSLRVVGIGEIPDSIVTDEGFQSGSVLLAPEFRRAHPRIGVPYFAYLVRLKPGASLVAFRRGVERLDPKEAIAFQTAPVTEAKFDRAVAPYVGALTIFAFVVAMTGVLLVGQALARQSFLASTDSPTLFALGVSRPQLFVLGMLRAALVAVGATAIAVGVAFACSPLLPLGPARTAEPDPGLAFDGLVLGLGAFAVLGVVLALAALPGWRDSRARSTAASGAGARPSGVSRALAGMAAPVSVVAGVRMALEPGRGRTAVPVRTTIVALGLAITVVLGAIGVAASIDHLVRTPRLFGWNWDVQVGVTKGSPKAAHRVHTRLADLLDHSSRVVGWSTVTLSDVRLAAGAVPAIGIAPRRRDVGPTLVSGRLPRRDDEIALGARTLRSLDAHAGSTVVARDNTGASRRLHVVGRVVLPGVGTYPGSDKTALGEGAVVTQSALLRLGGNFDARDYLLRFSAGSTAAARHRVVNRMSAIVDARGGNDSFDVAHVQRPSDILSYEGVRDTPVVLAGVLALLALASVAHALVTAVRRRRRDLAMLETLGFTRRQVSSTIAWQVTTVGLSALAIGAPLGVVLGRVSWTVLADNLGTVAEPITPVIVVLLSIPVVLALVNLIAYIPGRMAARLRPAVVLRSE